MSTRINTASKSTIGTKSAHSNANAHVKSQDKPKRYISLNRENGKHFEFIGFGSVLYNHVMGKSDVNEIESKCCAKLTEKEMDFYEEARDGTDFQVDLTDLHIRIVSRCLCRLARILGDTEFQKIVLDVMSYVHKK